MMSVFRHRMLLFMEHRGNIVRNGEVDGVIDVVTIDRDAAI